MSRSDKMMFGIIRSRTLDGPSCFGFIFSLDCGIAVCFLEIVKCCFKSNGLHKP